MKIVNAILIPGQPAVYDPMEGIYGIIRYTAAVPPTYIAVCIPTFSEFNELSNEVVWC